MGDGKYHLISPLFPSSLAHALHQRIVDARFSDETKAANQARKEGEWHEAPITYYLNTAVMNVGGTKPQNISYLNSVRGGRVWLLPCSPPQFKPIEKPPIHLKSIFQKSGPFHFVAKNNAHQLQQYLRSKLDCDSTLEIRERRQELVEDIIVQLFTVVEGIQREEWQGWTLDKNCELKRAQQLWLDPYRCRVDDDFKLEREGGDWKKAVDYLCYLHKQILLIQVLTPEEEEPSYSGRVNLIDLESADLSDERNMKLRITGSMHSAYNEAMADLKAEIKEFCVSRGAEFVSVRSDRPIEKMLFGELLKVGIMG